MWGKRKRWPLLAALGGALAIMAVGAGIALAVNEGTAGELNYRAITAQQEAGNFTVRSPCPPDRHVTGGGYRVAETDGMQISRSYTFDGPDNGTVPDDGWLVAGVAPVRHQVHVYAICDD